jgi:hypothetical protein
VSAGIIPKRILYQVPICLYEIHALSLVIASVTEGEAGAKAVDA